jgi:pilus assembly protein Flp/PilA
MFVLLELPQKLTSWMSREDGQTMAEYGILIAVIAIVVVVAAAVLGSSISSLFAGTATGL